MSKWKPEELRDEWQATFNRLSTKLLRVTKYLNWEYDQSPTGEKLQDLIYADEELGKILANYFGIGENDE